MMISQVVVVHTLVPAFRRPRRVDLWIQGQPDLQNKFQESLGYTEKPWIKEKKYDY